jgi:tRNA A37 threonylcarbamoyladenosine dehydratase
MYLDRFRKQIGDDNITKLNGAHVVIVGLGGVGSHACLTLARLGIGTFTICDYDKVDITNINRQAIAFNSTIGMFKTEVMKNMLLDINPNIKVNIVNEKIINNVDILISDKVDFIIDACDTVTTKIELIKYASSHRIKIISSMGVGNKLDPKKLEIIDINKTSYDPLAKVIRKKLKELNIKTIPVLTSTEIPIKRDIITSNAVVPSIAGILIADYVYKEIINEKF